MMSRRFVNLAMTDYNNCRFSLHRLDLSKLLFYPSTVEAEAAGGRRRRGRDRVDDGEPPKVGTKLRLPPPVMGFEPFPTSREPFSPRPDSSMFALLHGPRRRSSEASRILFTSLGGQASMYDVDSRSVISVPDLREPMGYRDTIAIVTGASAGAGEESLYVMLHGWEFRVLDFSGVEKSLAPYYSMKKESSSLHWESLPPLPVEADSISSFTVVDSDRIICVSAGQPNSPSYGEDRGTFCFDTVSKEWWHAGDWVLPFYGRAEHVPELDTWLGFSSDHPHHLCAADLSGVAMAPRQAPALRHVWEDFSPPPREETSLVLKKDYPGTVLTTRVNWEVIQHFLVNLGSGRFCIAKIVEGEKSVSLSWCQQPSRSGSCLYCQ